MIASLSIALKRHVIARTPMRFACRNFASISRETTSVTQSSLVSSKPGRQTLVKFNFKPEIAHKVQSAKQQMWDYVSEKHGLRGVAWSEFAETAEQHLVKQYGFDKLGSYDVTQTCGSSKKMRHLPEKTRNLYSKRRNQRSDPGDQILSPILCDIRFLKLIPHNLVLGGWRCPDAGIHCRAIDSWNLSAYRMSHLWSFEPTGLPPRKKNVAKRSGMKNSVSRPY